jgi:teichoic acid transport system ATP-binding protein
MEDDIIIKFQNVTKSYKLFKNESEQFAALFYKKKLLRQHMAIQDVSFEIKKGEVVGIIGRNGAGKSTVLKIITGVTFPSSGTVDIHGRVGALLELTAGFSFEMTGRENIFLKGYILGYSKKQVHSIENEIIEFAELGEYIDQPVRTYSSGMRTRLGFAINVSTEPDILVIDEALSVGDSYFREKCNQKIKSMVENKVTVLYVSHTLSAIEELCERVLYLSEGRLVFDGDAGEAFKKYKANK